MVSTDKENKQTVVASQCGLIDISVKWTLRPRGNTAQKEMTSYINVRRREQAPDDISNETREI